MQAPSAITALPAASKEERGEQEQVVAPPPSNEPLAVTCAQISDKLDGLLDSMGDISLLAPTFAGAIIA